MRRIIQRDYFDGASRDDVATDMSLGLRRGLRRDNASLKKRWRSGNAHVRKYWWCYDAERLKQLVQGVDRSLPSIVGRDAHFCRTAVAGGRRGCNDRWLLIIAALARARPTSRAVHYCSAGYEAPTKAVVKAIQRANTRFKEQPRARSGNGQLPGPVAGVAGDAPLRRGPRAERLGLCRRGPVAADVGRRRHAASWNR